VNLPTFGANKNPKDMKEKNSRRIVIFGLPLTTFIGTAIPKAESWLSLIKMGKDAMIQDTGQVLTWFDIAGWTVLPILTTLFVVVLVKLWYRIRDLEDLLHVTHIVMNYRAK
jgi:uncharacterized membrane protein YhdT